MASVFFNFGCDNLDFKQQTRGLRSNRSLGTMCLRGNRDGATTLTLVLPTCFRPDHKIQIGLVPILILCLRVFMITRIFPKTYLLAWGRFRAIIRFMKLRKKTVIFICMGLAVVGVIIYVIVQHTIAARPFWYAGTLETSKVVVSARVASDIAAFAVAEGDMVPAGAPLMTLTCDAYKILGTQIDREFDRAVALMERGHISRAEYDVLTRNKRDNDLKLSWCDVRAPISGMIITKFREAGEVVAPGAPLISMANPYDIWAYFYVPYTMLHALYVGQSVTGILPEAPDVRFPGRIIKISEEAEFTPKNVQTRQERTRLVYGVKVRFDNPDLTLKSGMTIESTLLDGQD